jgi:diaminopimelate epimerase
MNGAGNAFIMIPMRQDDFLNQTTLSKFNELIIDSYDQLIFIHESKNESFCYSILNRDGSQAEQCGNGARCVVNFVQHFYKKESFELYSQKIKIKYLVQNGEIGVCLGHTSENVPAQHKAQHHENTFQDNQDSWQYNFISVGNPHAVIYHNNILDIDLNSLKQSLLNTNAFPEGVNLGVYSIDHPGQISLRVHERGVGETLACGTGAVAAASIAIKTHELENPLAVKMKGGTLRVLLDANTQETWLFGPSEIEKELKIDI